MNLIDNLHEKAITLAEKKGITTLNIRIQVQSYRRVFLWDQLGIIVHEDEAICINEGDSIDDRIAKAYEKLISKLNDYCVKKVDLNIL